MKSTIVFTLGVVVAMSNAAAAQIGTETSDAAEPILEWPRVFTAEDGSSIALYQPQIEAWHDSKHLRARAVVEAADPAGAAPTLGAVVLEADTLADLEARMADVADISIVEGRFPALDDDASTALLTRLQDALPKESIPMSLDRLLAAADRQDVSARPVALKNDPPKIYFRREPAVLVLFDGQPLMSPIGGTDLRVALNTNWDVFAHGRSGAWYLRIDDGWISAPSLRGPWTPAGPLPADFAQLPDDENWADVRAALPGRRLDAGDVPEVIVRQAPAELILIEGSPRLDAIPGTRLAAVANTESDLFLCRTDGRYYYLVAGRWFAADTLNSPWSYASPDLPEDFARIPSDDRSARACARVDKPGTPNPEPRKRTRRSS